MDEGVTLTYDMLLFAKAYIKDGDMRGLSVEEFKKEWEDKNNGDTQETQKEET
jgi:hypothetical protein